MQSRQYVLASRPYGLPSYENFRIESFETGELNEGEVLLKSLYISVDPYIRGRMSNLKSYASSFQIDQPVKGAVVAKVLESRSSSFVAGDTIAGILPWSTYCTEKGENIRKVDSKSVPASYYLGVLGMPGLTAYFGMLDIGKPKPGQTVLISGAAGAVGIVAGQIAKIQGARVVGIAGSDEKCKLLKAKFGFDEAENYNSRKPLRKVIASTCPKGVDVYFDNVGGEITNAAIANLNFHARIALCGQISQYNLTRVPRVPAILPVLLTRSIMVQGYIVGNYSDRFGEGLAQLTKWINEGAIKYNETIISGFEKLPDAFLGLFSGKNIGKMLVKTD